MSRSPSVTTPAYKEPWFWMVFAPLILVVCVCSILLYVAISGSDDVVSDNYYKEGRLINNRFDMEQQAAKQDIALDIRFDLQVGDVIVQSDRPLTSTPLKLVLSHPAEAGLDQTIMLTKVTDNRFQGELTHSVSGRWYVIIEGLSEQGQPWRLADEIQFDDSQRISLSAQTSDN